jgi:hypothetical protein
MDRRPRFDITEAGRRMRSEPQPPVERMRAQASHLRAAIPAVSPGPAHGIEGSAHGIPGEIGARLQAMREAAREHGEVLPSLLILGTSERAGSNWISDTLRPVPLCRLHSPSGHFG